MIDSIFINQRWRYTFYSIKFYATIILLPLLTFPCLAYSHTSGSGIDTEGILKRSNQKSHFEKNIGQWDVNILGIAEANNLTARFYDDKVSFLLKSVDQKDVVVYNMLFENHQHEMQVDFVYKKAGKKNYLGCVENVPLFEEARYINVYPNIDLRFYLNSSGEMEFDYLVKPGGDPCDIRYKLDGLEDFKIEQNGKLTYCSPFGLLNSGKPYSYQGQVKDNNEIQSSYNIADDIISFQVDNFDREEILIIDPTVLEWSTYIGGTGSSFRNLSEIYLDGEFLYLCGFDLDRNGAYDYPITPGAYTANDMIAGLRNMVVSKFDTLGNLHFSTYLSVINEESRIGNFDYDNAQVFFFTSVSDGNLFVPGISPTAFDNTTDPNSTEAVVGSIDSNGQLIWSTYLGGSGDDSPVGISAHNGVVAVVGKTISTDFPLFQPSPNTPIPNNSTWLSKFDYDGSILYSSYLGIEGLSFVDEKHAVLQHNGYTAITAYLENGIIHPITQNPAPILNGSLESIFHIIYDGNNIEHYSTQYDNEMGAKVSDVDFDGNMICIASFQVGTKGFTTPGAHKETNTQPGSEAHLYCIDVSNADVQFATYTNLELLNKDEPHIEIYTNEVYVAGLVYRNNFVVTGELYFQKFDEKGVEQFYHKYGFTASRFSDLEVNNGVPILAASIVPNSGIFTPTPDAVQINPLNSVVSGNFIFQTSLNGDIEYATWLTGTNPSIVLKLLTDGSSIYAMGSATNGFPTTVGAYQTQNAVNSPISGQIGSIVSGTTDYFLLRINDAPCIDDIEPENTITPELIEVCMNGTVPFITGSDVAIVEDSLPHYLIDGVLTLADNNYQINYQWQINFVGSAFWNNVSGATNISFQPQPLSDDANFRRIVSISFEDCLVADTSNITLIDVSSFQAPILPNDTVYYKCATSAINLDVRATGGTPPYTYQWSPIAGLSDPTSPTPKNTASESTIYNVEVTDANGCVFIEQFTVRVYEANAGSEMVACIGTGVQIGTPHVAPGVPGFTYSWSPSTGLNNSSIAQPIAFPSVPTTYTLSITGPDDCTVTDDVLIEPVQTIADAGPDITFCLGGTIQIGEVNDTDYDFIWSPGADLSSTVISMPTYNPPLLPNGNPSVYYLTKIHKVTGCTDIDSVLVYVNDANAGLDFCGPRFIGSGDHSSGLANFTWSVVSGDASSIEGQENLPTPFVSPNQPTTYALEVEWNGVICTDQVFVPNCGCLLPQADANSDFNCPVGDVVYNTVIFGGTVNTTLYDYQWSPTAGIPDPTSPLAQNFTLSLTSPTLYTLTATLKANPAISCASSVLLLPAPDPFLFATAVDTISCLGVGVNIGGPTIGGWFASWSPDDGTLDLPNTFNPIANPSQNSTYIVTIEENSTECQVIDTVTVEVFDIIADAGPDSELCENSIVMLGTPAIPGLVYSWEPSLGLTNSDSAQPIDTIFASTTYYLTVSDSANTCTVLDTLVYTVVNNPIANAGENVVICQGGLGALIGTPAIPGNVYQWSPATGLSDPNIAQPNANPSSNTTYTLTVSNNAAGCFSTDAILVTVANGEPIDAGPSTTVCAGETVVLGTLPPESGYTYTWTPPTGLDNPNIPKPTATVTSKITYTLTMTAPTGCVVQDTVTLIPSIPIVDAGEDIVTCPNVEVSIGTPSLPGYTYTWSPTTGLNNPNIAQPVLTTGNADAVYTVTATDSNNCSASDDIDITIQTVNVDAGPDLSFCNSPVTIGAASQGSGFSYSWTPSLTLSNPNIAQPQATPSVLTIYTVVITDLTTGCSAEDEVEVAPNTIANAGPDFEICANESLVIGTPAVAGNSYTWSPATGLSNPNIAQPTASLTGPIVYTLTVSQGGCTSVDNVVITMLDPPSVTINSFEPLCQGSCVQLGTDSNPSFKYAWSPSEGLSDPNISDPIACPINTTTYTLEITNLLNGCTAQEHVTVSVASSPSPNPFAGLDKQLCPGETTNLGALFQNTKYTYSWSPIDYLSSPFAASTQLILPAGSQGEFTYILTAIDNATSCFGMDTVVVTMNDTPAVPLFSNENICQNSTLTICAGCQENPNYTYSWSPSETVDFPNALSVAVSPDVSTTYTLTITDNLTSCSDVSAITVLVDDVLGPQADAGLDRDICLDESIQIGQNDQGDNYIWYPLEHRNLLSNAFISEPTFTPIDTGHFVLWLEVEDAQGCTTTDTIEISVLDNAIVDAGISFFTCGNAASLEANLIDDINGVWSLLDGPNIPNIVSPFSPTTQLTDLIAGTYRFAWTITSDDVCNTGDFDIAIIEVTAGPDVDINTECNTVGGLSQFSYTISVTGTGFSGTYNLSGFNTQDDLAYNVVHGPFGPFPIDQISYSLVVEHAASDCSDIIETITPNCAEFDFGDLPDFGPGTAAADYETLTEHNGPSHRKINNLYFATMLDTEVNGQPSVNALGDGADEDAFSFLINLKAIKEASYNFPLHITNTTGSIAHVEIWVDWNADGDFMDLDEFVFDLQDDGNGNFTNNILTLDIPSHAVENQAIGFRARISHEDNMTPLGMIASGEVEDYLFEVVVNDEVCLPLIIEVRN